MFDIVAQNFRDLVHQLIHSRDGVLQMICFFANYFVHNDVRERQNALELVQKTQWYLAVFILYLQELSDQALPLLLIRQQRARTSNVTLAIPKTAFAIGFNYKVSMFC